MQRNTSETKKQEVKEYIGNNITTKMYKIRVKTDSCKAGTSSPISLLIVENFLVKHDSSERCCCKSHSWAKMETD